MFDRPNFYKYLIRIFLIFSHAEDSEKVTLYTRKFCGY